MIKFSTFWQKLIKTRPLGTRIGVSVVIICAKRKREWGERERK